MHPLVATTIQSNERLAKLSFVAPVAYVYNPADYAFANYREYLERYANPPKRVLFVGMNPGPFGMSQTGIPFGDVVSVRNWFKLTNDIGRPPREHPKRPVVGLGCKRVEVSGTRLWGTVQMHFCAPERFFAESFVHSYCPLAFIEESGRNRTPDKLPEAERRPLFAACDDLLRQTIDHLRPRFVIGIGQFARDRCANVLKPGEATLGSVTHPSPANPKANSDWGALVAGELAALGVCADLAFTRTRKASRPCRGKSAAD